jgi:hypothetical protein
VAKHPILERPDDQKTVRIVGNVFTDLSADDFSNKFVEWLESNGWSFFGRTVDLNEDDDDNEIWEGILDKPETK